MAKHAFHSIEKRSSSQSQPKSQQAKAIQQAAFALPRERFQKWPIIFRMALRA
jgi:hypothetical protein